MKFGVFATIIGLTLVMAATGCTNSRSGKKRKGKKQTSSMAESKRTGLVRASGSALRDDQGEFQALGASLFWGAWGYKFDRAKLERNLEFLSLNGFDYIRVLGVVGRQPWWSGRESDHRWPDYDQVIAGLTDLAYDKYGLRIQWTLIGDGDQVIPNRDDRFRLVDRFVAMSRGREQKIIHFEIANESWQNGFGEAAGVSQLRELSRYLKDKTDILVAASTPEGVDVDYCAEATAMYQNDVADMITFHFSRNTSTIEKNWRHVRQPWEHCSAPVPRIFSNNEPMGPGSSVAQENDPYALVAAAINTYISNGAFYVYHTEAGVWGGKITEFSGKSDLYEYPQSTAFRAMKQYLPANLAGWTRHNTYNNPQHPFWIFADNDKDKITSESAGYRNGVTRSYGSRSGTEFLVMPIGLTGTAKFEAKGDLEFEAIDPVTGAVKGRYCLRSGQQFQLSGLPTFVLKGRYNGACTPMGAGVSTGGTPSVPPAPATPTNPGLPPGAAPVVPLKHTIGVVVGAGGKVVFPDGYECRNQTCQTLFDPAAGIQISAVPDPGFTFSAWSIDGNCGGANANPLVKVNYPINCGANFVAASAAPAPTPSNNTPAPAPAPVASVAGCSDRANTALGKLYNGILWREMDSGASAWCGAIDARGLEGVVDVARALTNSDEFQNHTQHQHSRHELVNRMYEALLNRGIANDGDAISTWVEQTPPYADVVSAVIRYGGFQY